MKNKKIIILNIMIFLIFMLIRHFSLQENLFKYISFNSSDLGCNFKDLLSISATILAVFLGFIATAATVLVSMCDKRIMRIIKNMNKSKIILDSIKKSLKYGVICLVCIGIIYVNLDFNSIKFRIILILIILNTLFIFLCESKFLIGLVYDIMEQTLLEDEGVISKVKPKKNIK